MSFCLTVLLMQKLFMSGPVKLQILEPPGLAQPYHADIIPTLDCYCQDGFRPNAENGVDHYEPQADKTDPLHTAHARLCQRAGCCGPAEGSDIDRGVRTNQLVGYGVVVGLAGTGDGSSGLTLQSLQSMVSQFGLVTDAANLTAKNAAAVMVTAEMPAFMKPGQRMDVTVSTVGGAKSLRGGMLLMTPLLGADGETYAIAQGSLVVGGLGVTGNDGSSVIVNVPTVGRIPRGAFVERMVETPFQSTDTVLLNLHQGDFSTAMRVADAVNEVFGVDVATPLDASTIKVRAPLTRHKKCHL